MAHEHRSLTRSHDASIRLLLCAACRNIRTVAGPYIELVGPCDNVDCPHGPCWNANNTKMEDFLGKRPTYNIQLKSRPEASETLGRSHAKTSKIVRTSLPMAMQPKEPMSPSDHQSSWTGAQTIDDACSRHAQQCSIMPIERGCRCLVNTLRFCTAPGSSGTPKSPERKFSAYNLSDCAWVHTTEAYKKSRIISDKRRLCS